MMVLQVTTAIIGTYLLFYSLYWMTLTFLGKRKESTEVFQPNYTNPEVLLVLPAYKPGPIFLRVLDSVEKAIESRKANVFVLLQEAEESYATYARSKGFIVIKRKFSHLRGNSYQRALRFIANTIDRKREEKCWNPEFVMLVDKDNLISEDFFAHISRYHYDRFDIIQGRRCALSTESSLAFFDNLTEQLNDTLYRSAKERLNLIIELSGSGCLIETDLFIRNVINLDPKAPGFDKNFMVQLLEEKRPVKSVFLPDCILWEEKTSSLEAHNPQRLRWFGEQYYNAVYHAGTLLSAAYQNKRIAALDYWITLCRPPRSLQLVLTPMIALAEVIYFLAVGQWFTWMPLFSLATLITGIAVLVFLINNNVTIQVLSYSGSLLRLAFNNFFNASRSIQKKNLGTFIHTSHKL